MKTTADPAAALPRVVVLPRAWAAITEELERAAREGVERHGSPDEAVFVPLCAVTHRAGRLRAPQLERTALEDIGAVVVADALIPPREMVSLSTVRIKFRAGEGGWEQAQKRFDALIDAALAKRGRLDLLARGHSHPFDVESTHPSGPDRAEHLKPCLEYNRALGIDAGFTFIAVRGAGGTGWALDCFATRTGEDLVELGLAELPAEDGAYAQLLDAPFHADEEGARLEKSLLDAGAGRLRIDRLALGWSRYRVAKEGGEAPAALALPPSFPAALGRRFTAGEGGWQADDVLDWNAYLELKCKIQNSI